jgi:tetratricopeptide (TPR) repeat protein
MSLTRRFFRFYGKCQLSFWNNRYKLSIFKITGEMANIQLHTRKGGLPSKFCAIPKLESNLGVFPSRDRRVQVAPTPSTSFPHFDALWSPKYSSDFSANSPRFFPAPSSPCERLELPHSNVNICSNLAPAFFGNFCGKIVATTTLEPNQTNEASSTYETAAYTLAMLSKILDVPSGLLRRWYIRGLLLPVRQVKRLPYFDFSQVIAARNLARILSDSPHSATVEKQLARLSKIRPDWQSLLSSLDFVVNGRTVLIRESGERLVDTSGQFHFDFYHDESAEADEPVHSRIFSITPLDDRDSPETVEELLQIALEHEDNQEPQAAIAAYRRMLQTFGPTADSCFAIAEVFYAMGDLVAARERYYNAVELDEGFVEALANLGCVLVELGELKEARRIFERALRHHPDYPDVHFHLAKLLDQLELPDIAVGHWERFLELAPRTPWSDEALERLEHQSS